MRVYIEQNEAIKHDLDQLRYSLTSKDEKGKQKRQFGTTFINCCIRSKGIKNLTSKKPLNQTSQKKKKKSESHQKRDRDNKSKAKACV